MSEETRKVLDMLKEGKISSDDAERLLDKLGPAGATIDTAGNKEDVPEKAAGTAKKLRYLRIMVERPGAKEVNIRMPLSFVRSSQSLLSLLPARVAERLQERGVFVGVTKLHSLNNEDFAQAVEELNVDIDEEGGKKVKIFCE
jgi:ribosome maturation protein Sdo1